MSRRFYFTQAARDDLLQIHEYYRQIDASINTRFDANMRAAMESIRVFPTSYQIVWGQKRRAPIRGFLHGIFYEIQGDGLLIVAIIHAAQYPHIWRSRS